MPTHVMSVARFERFFREAASLDVDKDDLRRYDDFVHDRIYDLLVRAEGNAKANQRDVIEPQDVPITSGLQENIERFRHIDHEIELRPILDRLATRPSLNMALTDAAEAQLPQIAGGLSVALAHTFKIIDPKLKNPHGAEWEQCGRVFDELL
jgi:Domain of unknown function (DUF1931)